jgi:hypothetical protein
MTKGIDAKIQKVSVWGFKNQWNVCVLKNKKSTK